MFEVLRLLVLPVLEVVVNSQLLLGNRFVTNHNDNNNNNKANNNNNNKANNNNMTSTTYYHLNQRIALRRTLAHGPVSIAEVVQPDTDFQVDLLYV